MLRIVVGGVFLYAGCNKIFDPAGFSISIFNYLLFPDWAIHAIAIVLPWIEVLIGLNLILGLWVYGGSLLSTFLLICFFSVILISLFRGLDISCGCFSTDSDSNRISFLLIGRDLSLIVASLAILLFENNDVSIFRFFFKRG